MAPALRHSFWDCSICSTLFIRGGNIEYPPFRNHVRLVENMRQTRRVVLKDTVSRCDMPLRTSLLIHFARAPSSFRCRCYLRTVLDRTLRAGAKLQTIRLFRDSKWDRFADGSAACVSIRSHWRSRQFTDTMEPEGKTEAVMMLSLLYPSSKAESQATRRTNQGTQ